MNRRKSKPLCAADLFCGAGGFTTGAEQAGVRVALAVNHWRTAIYTHQANHPHTRHICARIDDVDPRHDRTIPDLDLLLASPECTHHSIARGGRPIDDQKRATPWHVCAWTEAKRPAWVIVENVREFRDWGPLDQHGRPIKSRKGETFRAWVRSLESLGYQVDHQILNAADYGAPTKRHRLFIIARRGRARSDIPWPAPTHARGQWRPAWSVIDWSLPCPSIFGRKRPLADNTIRRIEAGLRKFVGQGAEPFIVRLRATRGEPGTGGTVHSTGQPLGTVTAGGKNHALAVPFQLKAIGRNPGLTKAITDPLPTIVAAQPNHAVVVPFILPREGIHRGNAPAPVDRPLHTIVAGRDSGHLVVPFLVPHFGERDDQPPRTHALDQPAPTVTGQGAGSLVVPFLIDVNHGGHDFRTHDPRGPVNTVTASRGEALCLPFLTKYYGTAGAIPVDEPLDTVTARDHFGLAMTSLIRTMRELCVVDVGFRMLEPAELAAAQGFPAGYAIGGTKAEQVRQIGNAVCPPVAKALCQTIVEAAA